MLTKQDVLELFAKTDKRIDRLAARQEKTDAQIAETNRGIAELRESQKKTDAQIAKTSV